MIGIDFICVTQDMSMKARCLQSKMFAQILQLLERPPRGMLPSPVNVTIVGSPQKVNDDSELERIGYHGIKHVSNSEHTSKWPSSNANFGTPKSTE